MPKREFKLINVDIYPEAVQQTSPGDYFVPPCEKPHPVSLYETCQEVLYRDEHTRPRRVRREFKK